MGGIAIRDGFEQMDFGRVTALLSTAFWCPGIGLAEVEQGARHSALVVGAFLEDGTQVGYARVISDETRFAYLLDVIVDERHRRQGIGQKMVNAILAHPRLADVYQWLLVTKDAHGVYAKSGFKPVGRPADWLEIRHPRPTR